VTGSGLERGFSAAVGIVLVVVGLLGSVDNPLVGEAGSGALLGTGAIHDLLHVIVGALFIHVAVALRGRAQADSIIGLGVLLLATGVLSLLSGDVFGVYEGATSGLDQLMHLLVGSLAILVGWMARGGRAARVGRRSSPT
jgi:hypothetical protein